MLSKQFRKQLIRISKNYFGRKQKLDLTQNIEKNVQYIKHKETVKNVSDFKGFLDQSIKNNSIGNLMNKASR